jgi:SAM-dependent methyltransferase
VTSDPVDLNRAHWNERADLHSRIGSRYYDRDALVAGSVALGDLEEAAVREAVGKPDGDVAGMDVLHVQCHLAYDSIVLARRGARVVGADFSEVALAKAADLADRCGVELELVEADSRALPPSLHGRFDLVYATIGVVGWIDDIGAWMRSAASALRPGGRLALVELHPLYVAVGSLDPLVLDFPYGFDGPQRFEASGSYVDPGAATQANVTVEYGHSLGEIVTAAVAAGLSVRALHEHLDAAHPFRADVLREPDADGRYRLRLGGQPMPLVYTLIAERRT